MLKKYSKDYIPQWIIGPACKLFEAILELCVPLVMAAIIDNGILKNDSNYVLKMGIVLVLLGAVGLSSALVCQYMASYTSQGIGTKLRSDLLRHINTLSHKELDEIGTPTLINRMTSDINAVQLHIAMIMRLLLRAPFLIIGALIMACFIDLKISIIFFIASLLIGLVLYLVMTKSLPFFKKSQKFLDKIALISRENLEGNRVIRAFSKQNSQKQQMKDTADDLTKNVLTVSKLSALLNPATYVITYSAIIFILWIGGEQVYNGQLLSGDVIALTSYMTQILLAMIVLANLVVILSKGMASTARLNEIFNVTPSVKEPFLQGAIKLFPSIQFNNVSFSYGGGDNELENISFEIEAGSVVGIIGSTGSGKSTLLNLIMRFYDVTSGSVLFHDMDVRNQPLNHLRKRIGFVPQKAVLFSGTVRSNLLWKNPDATDEELWEALEIAKCRDFVENLPGKLDARISQGGKNLSGGQRQRLCIARAIVSMPDTIILDDSFSALDFATEKALRQQLIEKKNKYTTIIIVTQRCSTIMNADRILVLEDGKLVGNGTHSELLENCDTYKELCISQEVAQ